MVLQRKIRAGRGLARDADSPSLRHGFHEQGQVIPEGEAVADEENFLERSRLILALRRSGRSAEPCRQDEHEEPRAP